VTTRAVVFDLWDTLAAWPREDMSPLLDTVGLSMAEWSSAEHRDRRWSGPFHDYLATLGLDARAAARAVELRNETTQRALVPVPGALAVLEELRARGLRLGLVSNCSSEVGELWERSPFAGRFDAVVLSADAGVCKPSPRIYRLVLERLGVEPERATFVGDGHSDELGGAERAGMRAIQLGSRGGWNGARIRALSEVLDHV
jgi:HAD superfamily hydrolase (TIGR01509 family)